MISNHYLLAGIIKDAKSSLDGLIDDIESYFAN